MTARHLPLKPRSGMGVGTRHQATTFWLPEKPVKAVVQVTRGLIRWLGSVVARVATPSSPAPVAR